MRTRARARARAGEWKSACYWKRTWGRRLARARVRRRLRAWALDGVAAPTPLIVTPPGGRWRSACSSWQATRRLLGELCCGDLWAELMEADAARGRRELVRVVGSVIIWLLSQLTRFLPPPLTAPVLVENHRPAIAT